MKVKQRDCDYYFILCTNYFPKLELLNLRRDQNIRALKELAAETDQNPGKNQTKKLLKPSIRLGNQSIEIETRWRNGSDGTFRDQRDSSRTGLGQQDRDRNRERESVPLVPPVAFASLALSLDFDPSRPDDLYDVHPYSSETGRRIHSPARVGRGLRSTKLA